MEQEVERFKVVDRTHLRFVSTLVCDLFYVLFNSIIIESVSIPSFPCHCNVVEKNTHTFIDLHFDYYSQTNFVAIVFVVTTTIRRKKSLYALAIFISIDFLVKQLLLLL